MADSTTERRWLFGERVGSFRHLPALLRLVGRASPPLTVASFILRIARASLPVLILYVGKLIIDEVVDQARQPAAGDTFGDWLSSGRLDHLGWLLALEFSLAILSDVLARASALVDGLLSELYSNYA